MKKILVLSASLIFISITVFSQVRYPSDSINPSLRIHANYVIRSAQQKVTIVSEKKVLVDFKYAITLLNEDAEDIRFIEVPYDNLRKVKYIRGFVYNEAGKLVWTLKSFNITDIRDFSGPGILSDERMKIFEFPAYNYPYTIEYSVGYEGESFAVGSRTFLQPDANASAEASGLQYIVPRNIDFKYLALNVKNPTDSLITNKHIVYTWQEENLPARRQREFTPAAAKLVPVIYTTQVDFNLRGYQGSFNSWQSFGVWVNKLLEGRNVLDNEYASKALALVKDIKDRREKVKVLYEYMQKNTRYFYVAFGIGGYLPLPANEVAKNGYGDCKALSNYMNALLKAVGIESYYTLVNSGDNEFIEPRLVSNQFDHIIVCVPDQKDTIWLECTSQTNPFDYLGSFTCDRHVLAVTPEGGKLLQTPSYGITENAVSTNTTVKLYGSGDADIITAMNQSGLMYEDIKLISESKSDERKEWIAALLGLASLDITNEDYAFPKGRMIPVGKVKIEAHLRDFAARSSNRLFVTPSVLSKNDYMLEDPSAIEINTSYVRHDTVRIEIPLGYRVEFLPDELQLSSRFGRYSSSMSSDKQYIYFFRSYEIYKADYPKDAFTDFYRFITDMAINDRLKAVLKALN